MDLYENLTWLPAAPADFRKRCEALLTRSEGLGQALRVLAAHSLSEKQLGRLSQTIAALVAQGANLAPLTPFRLGLIGNATLDMIVPTLAASAARHGILLESSRAEFGQTIQEALNPQSQINAFKPDAVLFCLDHHGFPGLTAPDGVGDALRIIRNMQAGFRQSSGAVSIVQTFAPPAETLFGSLDRAMSQSIRGALDVLNHELAAEIPGTGDFLLDVAALAETIGLANWHSPSQWNLAKLPFSATYLPLYAEHVARLLGAMRGKSRRCLILDLDNTVWGGVIGDDGLDGIRIAQGDAVGEAYLDVQRMALKLRDRGIVLAVSSKNTDEVARSPFQQHPEMLLRENHIAVFQANWSDKATNITAIANALSLGLESMVFVDDNPVERGLIREILPQVAIPELGEDPALYARTVLAAGYFEAVTFSEEDRARADFYQRNAERVALQAQAGDVDAYLATLKMEIVFAPFNSMGRARISQLINKSNQYNLTTRRYSEPAVQAAAEDPAVFTLQVRLLDAFGDNGMISVVICKPRDPQTWEIDTWLMSCRVLGRRVEHMVLREILQNARACGISRIVGVYLPSERNAMVRDHYDKLGFSRFEEAPQTDTAEWWVIAAGTEIEGAPMTVRRSAEEGG